MASYLSFGDKFLQTEKHLLQDDQALYSRNRQSAQNGILQITDPLSKVNVYGGKIRDMFALAAAHMGYGLQPSDTVLIKTAPVHDPIYALGQTAAPDVNNVLITLHPLLEREGISMDEYGAFTLFMDVPGAFIGKRPTKSGESEFDLAPLLENVLIAEFAHAADLLGRNSRRELNAVQLWRNFADAAQRKKWDGRGCTQPSYSALYTALGVAEMEDWLMQAFTRPLDALLFESLTTSFLAYCAEQGGSEKKIAPPDKGHIDPDTELEVLLRQRYAQQHKGRPPFNESFFAYLEKQIQEETEKTKKINALDFGMPYFSQYVGLPSPHDQANVLGDITKMRLLSWWLQGYFSGKPEKLMVHAAQLVLQLGTLAPIVYASIREGTEEYSHAKKAGAIIGAALLMEGIFKEELEHKNWYKSHLKREMKHAREKISDLTGILVPNFPLHHEVSIGSYFSEGTIPIVLNINMEKRRFPRDKVIGWIKSQPDLFDEASCQPLLQIARNGTKKELSEWAKRFCEDESELLSMPNPLYAVAAALRSADSPVKLEEHVRKIREECLERLAAMPYSGSIGDSLPPREHYSWTKKRPQEKMDFLAATLDRYTYNKNALAAAWNSLPFLKTFNLPPSFIGLTMDEAFDLDYREQGKHLWEQFASLLNSVE